MITLILHASLHGTWGRIVELRTDVDAWDANPVLGVYDARTRFWKFELEFARYSAGFRFKFFLQPDSWQSGDDLQLPADQLIDGNVYEFDVAQLGFDMPSPTSPVVEIGWAQRRLYDRPFNDQRPLDAIVIGSGMAGGTLADHLADAGLHVLVLEAGGYLFPTHIGNLPREQKPGVFTKHIWELWDEFRATNYDSMPGSDYVGGQGFNLGGRSVFWGGFIPRMTSWELDFWPRRIKWYLEDIGYLVAEDFMGRSTAPRTLYNRQIQLLLRELFPEMNHADAPVAVRQQPEGANTIATGVFSTADVLSESILTPSGTGNVNLQVLLNHEVVQVEPGQGRSRVLARDLRRQRFVWFEAPSVILSAGCFESARIAKRSDFPDPDGLIGASVSDHPIFFTHFSVPRTSPYFDSFGGVKTLSQPKEGEDPKDRAPFNMLLELGADLNHGRYIDESVWLEHLEKRNERMLGEVVFLCNAELNPENRIDFDPGRDYRPQVLIKKYVREELKAQTNELKFKLLKALQAQPTSGDPIDPAADEQAWQNAFTERGDFGEGMPGGVAHEVGSLRMEVRDGRRRLKSPGLVDDNLKYLHLPDANVYACDLSVFPTSPAANPSLTVVALAIRLAEHLRERLRA
jgi:GMC oxidoreductase